MKSSAFGVFVRRGLLSDRLLRHPRQGNAAQRLRGKGSQAGLRGLGGVAARPPQQPVSPPVKLRGQLHLIRLMRKLQISYSYIVNTATAMPTCSQWEGQITRTRPDGKCYPQGLKQKVRTVQFHQSSHLLRPCP